MSAEQIQRRLDEIHTEYRALWKQQAAESGFLTSDPRYLRLRSLWEEEDRLMDKLDCLTDELLGLRTA